MNKKNIPTLLIALTVIVIILGLFLNRSAQRTSQYQGKQLKTNTIEYVLEGKKLQLLLADDDIERQRGLMYYRNLENADGMIFMFPIEAQQSFWNKNTLMDLDIYWIHEGNIIGKSYLPSIENSKEIVTVNSPAVVDTVIEIPR